MNATAPIVIVVRDPDSSNDFIQFKGSSVADVEIIDVDLGGMNLDDADEWADWEQGHLGTVRQLRGIGRNIVAETLENIVNEARENHGHTVKTVEITVTLVPGDPGNGTVIDIQRALDQIKARGDIASYVLGDPS